MNDMDGFSFIFNNSEGLFDFKDNDKKEETATATRELEKNEELELLKRNMHIKNQIILKLLSQCEAYSELVAEIIKSASTIPDEDTKNKIGGISKSFNDINQLNSMLKMAIEFEEMMESNENHTI